ncbi:MAG: sodium:calcium antiporter [Burkholderiales bacterium]
MDKLSTAILIFVVSSVFIIFAGMALARFGDEIAEKTGWGTLWVGTILVSVSTSLPELTVNISAVWVEKSPGLALGNVFGANMINIFVLAIAALIFGTRNLFGNQGRETQLLVQTGIGLVALAAVTAVTGDFKLGPSSVGGLLIGVAYVLGMRAVYNAGRAPGDESAEEEAPKGSPRNAFIGFAIASLVVIIAGKFLASSADDIAKISGIGASFIGVLLVSIVTTLPEGSVTIAACFRKSYGIAIGNVYGSCAFNVFVITIADFFHGGPLLRAMEGAHFVAAAAAFVLMTMGFIVIRSCQTSTMALARALTPVIPVVYVGALYLVFIMAK